MEGIKRGWRLLIRCLQVAPIFIGFGVMFLYFVNEFSSPKTLTDLLSENRRWWLKHGETLFCVFYGCLFVLFGIMLWLLAFIMKCFPDTFRDEGKEIQPAINELKKCGLGYFSVLLWVVLIGFMYYFVGL